MKQNSEKKKYIIFRKKEATTPKIKNFRNVVLKASQKA